MPKRSLNHKVIAAVLGLVLVLAFGGMASAEKAPGEIRLGVLTDLTGKASAVLGEANKGFADYVRYVNEKQGGLNGHPVKVFPVDTQYEVAKCTAGFRKLVDVHKVHLVNPQGSVIAGAVGQRANEEKVPLVMSFELGIQFPMKGSYIFSTTTPPEAFYPAALDYLVTKKFARDKPLRIGLYMLDIPWTNRVFKAVPEAVKKLGGKAELSFKRLFPASQLDFASQISEVRAAKLDILFFVGHGRQCVAFLKEAKRSGLKDELRIVEYPYAIEAGIRKATGEDAVKGVISPVLLATWDRVDVPGIKFLHELNAEWYPEVKERHWVYLVGWNYARVSLEGIKKALEKVGYDKLDGPAIREGLESLKNLDMQGIIAPVTYSPEVHVTFGDITLSQYEGDGKWQPLGPALPMAPWTPEMLTVEYWK